MIKKFLSARSLQALACLFLFGTMAAPLASKFGLWHFSAAFMALRILFFFGAAVFVLALVLMLIKAFKQGKQDAQPYGLAILIAFLPLVMMLYQVSQAKSLPYIHDISTDTNNPPIFTHALTDRKVGENSAIYAGIEIATQQKEAYADITPVQSQLPPNQAFTNMLTSMKNQGMHIVTQYPVQGHIEATSTTFWFGFTDDIVVRVVASKTGSLIDIRSASRVGKSDIGKNAARIRNLIKAFNQLP
jgi:uncharacterized protein (DUF1499 family)